MTTPVSPTFDALADYQARGWAVVELHYITNVGVCSCGLAGPDHYGVAGKHPVRGGWQARGMTTWADVYHTWSNEPNANVGVVTGRASGVWVLDVDPEHGGDAELAALEEINGALPYTYTVRTGSGGTHHYFSMPADFEPTNSRGRLPVGLDVRGTGGQVVAPPSRSAKGTYRVATSAPVAPAPAWLLDLIRPARASGSPGSVMESIGYEMLRDDRYRETTRPIAGSVEAQRVARYALAAAQAELNRVAGAVEGTRNETAFAAACSLHELCAAPWSGLDLGATYAAYGAAISACGLPAAEGDAVWLKAQARTSGHMRAYPVLPDLRFTASTDSATGLMMPPFAPAPGAGPTGYLMDPFVVPSALASPSPGTDALGPVERLAAMRARLLSSADLDTVPKLDPLVDGYLWRDGIAWVIGKSGEGKTFVALDLALCVAAGRDWHGVAVKTGRVLYVVAEGARGIRPRVRAWERKHNGGQLVTGIEFYPEPVQARVDSNGRSTEWDTLVDLVTEDQPDLVILDTQARVTVGIEENSNSEMGVFVEQLDRIRRATAGCVMVVHHQGHAGVNARGASALKGAAQTELTISRSGDRVTVATSKQKDAPELAPVHLHLVQVPAVVDPEATGEATFTTPTQAVEAGAALIPWVPAVDELLAREDDLSHAQALLAAVFLDVFYAGHGGTQAQIREDFEKRGGTRRSFYRAWNTLLDRGCFGKINGKESYRWIPADERDERS